MATLPPDAAAPGEIGGESSPRWSWACGAAVALSVAWGLWQWRSALRPVPFLDDNSVHEQMVRFATARLAAGHSPYASWFPYLGLGSPQFLHYQGLAATLVGAIGVGVGGAEAFRWALYLLLAAWPVAVYLAGRVFGLSRPASAAAAVAAPFLASAKGVGYEPEAYIWIGWGVWTQLCAAWTLPFAWAFTWRAVSARRAIVLAVAFVALTVALHFETGYLALGGVVVIGIVAAGPLWHRLGRAALVLGGSLVASAWVILPLVVSSPWAARNQVLGGTPLENGYGAKQVLAWLFEGKIYDNGRLPVVSVLAAVGLIACIVRWRRSSAARAMVALWAFSLVLSFGRTTFGPLTDLIPGGHDLFMRRFGMGAQLAGLFLAGMGAVVVGRGVAAWATTVLPRYRIDRRVATVGALVVVAVAALWPLLAQMDAYASQNATAVDRQASAGAAAAGDLSRIVTYVDRHGGGRVYAGMPSNWGASFTVGAVPVFQYLESVDVDQVGYTLRTASLMTDPEYHFNETNPGDFSLFGIRYLVLPPWRPPPVPATLVFTAGNYWLYVLPANGYVRVVDTVGVLEADRTDVGSRSVPYMASALPAEGRYLTVAWAGRRAATPTQPAGGTAGIAGVVTSTQSALPDGQAGATVVAYRRAVVVLSASFDPGWVATVDGRRVPTQMLAPALVGVAVGPGRHTVTWSYQAYEGYPVLWVLAGTVLVAVPVVAWAIARRRAR